MLRTGGRLRAGGSGYDSDAQAWATAVTANGGTYSTTTLRAVSDFCKSAKASGYWTKLTRINLFCGGQLAAALVPLKVGGGNATDTNVNFVSGDYSESTGLTGNASNKYLNTGLNASALTTNSTHLAIYNRGADATSKAVLGVHSDASGTEALSLFGPYSDGAAYSDQYKVSASGRISSALTGPFGLVIGTRTAANSHVLYEHATSRASSTTSDGALPAFPIFVFVLSSAGTPDGSAYGVGPFGAYSIGAGLSSSDVTAYTTHMEAFQDALGRGVQ